MKDSMQHEYRKNYNITIRNKQTQEKLTGPTNLRMIRQNDVMITDFLCTLKE